MRSVKEIIVNTDRLALEWKLDGIFDGIKSKNI